MTEDIELTHSQLEAINEINNNLQIVACAGSGKTEIISRRIANILINKTDVMPENIVAFTFTEKAAESLKKRIVKALGVSEASLQNMYIGTIHGFCWHLLKKYAEIFSEYKILDSVKNHLFVERYHKECGMDTLKLEAYPHNIRLFLQCIDKMIDDYDNSKSWSKEYKTAFEQYISCLYKHKYIDFSLMIFETLKQIKENVSVSKYLENIKYLVVDEYQDVNDLQEKLISCISEYGANICVVGDDDQAIYKFRGSNADNMLNFPQKYNNVHQVKLEENFRCTKEIVELADCVIKNNNRRLAKKMFSESQAPGEIKAIRYESKSEEYQGIADTIKELYQSGIPYKKIAVLVRKGKTISGITNAFVNNDIPFETDSAEHFFTSEYFKKFVNTLQILSDIDIARLYDCWNMLIADEKIKSGFRFLRSSARSSAAKFSEILTTFCNITDFVGENVDDIEIRRNDLNGICKILDDYDEIYGDWQLSARITGMLKFIVPPRVFDEYKYHNFTPKDENTDAVQIMTVHKAKGLEFHTVFLPEMMRYEFPVANIGGKQYWHILGGTFEKNKDKYQSDIEDERNLFYVAVTRAKQNLYFTYELSKQPVSNFVKEAASSKHLIINRNDLNYNPKEEADEYEIKHRNDMSAFSYEKAKPDYEEEKRQREMYWETVRYAKSELYDYYGTGAHFCPGMYSLLDEIKMWSPEQIISEAQKNGLI